MKSMVLTGLRQMEMREVADPVIKHDSDVLIRMCTVGVCGSDVHYYLTGKIGSQVVQYPFAVGHECAGVIERVGPGVTRVKPGDRIAIDPAISCWDCDQCKAGRHHTCRKLRFLGCPGQMAGCLSEYIVMDQNNCYVIKDSMTMEQGAISEPLAIGVYAVKQSLVTKDMTVGILGAGPIGLSVLLAAQVLEAKKIYVTDKIDERVKVAQQVGPFWSGNPEKQDIVENITAHEPSQLDVVFECCGQQEALDQAINLLKPGGKLMLIGIPEIERISFPIDQLRRKEICVQNVRRQLECVQPALDMIDNGCVDVDFMVTHHFSFDQTKEAFDLVADYRDGVIKAMITF